jgi:outer membrane lipoprotein-sorting protein
MKSLLQSRRARWAVPAGAITAVAAAITGGALLAGASSPTLPDKTAGELIADMHNAEPQPFSGTLVQTSRLGLPDLPELEGDEHTTSLLSMLTGSNTARVWYLGPEQVRFALMGAFDETNVIRDGTDLWIWSSSANTAEHLTLPAAFSVPEAVASAKAPITPDQATDRILTELDSTDVTVDGTAEVAGRAAYELVVSPRDDRSLVGDVRIAIDAETSMPLRFELNGRDGGDPVFEVGFTSVTFSEPSPDVFRFNPPPGAEVTELNLLDLMTRDKGSLLTDPPQVLGEGWTSVLVVDELTLPETDGQTDDSGMLDALLAAGTRVEGGYGAGTLYETALVSALWLDDGTLLVGAVTPDVLEETAEGLDR